MKILLVILLCSAGLIYADSDDVVEHGAPFTHAQITELYNLIAKGATLKQVQAVMDRAECQVWHYRSNSGTIPITVHVWCDRYGRSVSGHFNSDGIMVYGAHDVSTFAPLKDPGKKAREARAAMKDRM